MLSLVYGIHNRTELFEGTLNSLAVQTLPASAWEIVVVDDEGTDARLHDVLLRFHRETAVPVQYHCLDLRAFPLPVFPGNGEAHNPCVAWNIGIRKAKGDRLVLSSPEIMHSMATNLEELAEWYMPRRVAVIGDVWDEEYAEDPRMMGWIAGGPNRRPLAFLQLAWTQDLIDIGGFEERFISGHAWDDVEFVDRWRKAHVGFEYTGPAVQALHQWHPRPSLMNDTVYRERYEANRRLCESLAANPRWFQANVGHAWGDGRWVAASKVYAGGECRDTDG